MAITDLCRMSVSGNNFSVSISIGFSMAFNEKINFSLEKAGFENHNVHPAIVPSGCSGTSGASLFSPLKISSEPAEVF